MIKDEIKLQKNKTAIIDLSIFENLYSESELLDKINKSRNSWDVSFKDFLNHVSSQDDSWIFWYI